MKITKDRLRELIKEELAELEQEGKPSWMMGGNREREPRQTRSRGIKISLPSPEQEFTDKVQAIFLNLINPITGQGDPAPSEQRITQIVDLYAKDMKPEKIKAAVEMIQKLADIRVTEVRSDLVDAFKATVEKLKSTLQQKIQPAPQVPLKMDESKIKVTFRKK